MNPIIAVVGSVNSDMVIKTHRIPRPGETVLGGSFAMAPGGKGANQAVAAARAGGDVIFIARVGNDVFGNEAIARFLHEKIDVFHITKDAEKPSGVALITVDDNGENSIAVALGANEYLLPSDIEQARNSITSADVVLLQLETPLASVRKAISIAAEKHIPVILNPAPAMPLEHTMVQMVTILTPNKTEAGILSGIEITNNDSLEAAAAKLLSMGVKIVIITLGEKGSYLAADTERRFIPAFEVKALDTTAAGDVFSGALAVALGERKGLEDAIRFASAAAAISVTRLGAQPSVPHKAEIEAFLNNPKSL
jgi:ribokinase